MPRIHVMTAEERKVGTALAERAKLDPSITLQDYDVQFHGDKVTIRFEVFHQMTRAEFESLRASVIADKK